MSQKYIQKIKLKNVHHLSVFQSYQKHIKSVPKIVAFFIFFASKIDTVHVSKMNSKKLHIPHIRTLCEKVKLTDIIFVASSMNESQFFKKPKA